MRPGNKNIVQDGINTRFSSTRQPANAGRKPKLYTIAKKVYNIGYDEWKGVTLYLMQLTKNELESVIEMQDTPIWVVNIARAIHKDTGRGVTFTLRELLDRVFGKAGNIPVIDSDQDNEDISKLTTTELKTLLRLREKMRGGADD